MQFFLRILGVAILFSGLHTVAFGADPPKLKETLPGAQSILRTISFSPDGKLLATAGDDKNVRLWDVDAGKDVGLLKGHKWTIWSAAFSRDGKLLASGSNDYSVKIWDVPGKKEKATFVIPKDGPFASPSIYGVVFSADGKQVISADSDGAVRLWTVASGEHVTILHAKRNKSAVRLAVSPDGKTLAVGMGGGEIVLWDFAKEKETATLDKHKEIVFCLAFSPDGKTLASGSQDKTLRLWDVETGKERGTLDGHKFYVLSVAFSPDGETLASASDEVRLWKLSTGKVIASLEGKDRNDPPRDPVAFSPNGKFLATGSDGGKTLLWELAK